MPLSNPNNSSSNFCSRKSGVKQKICLSLHSHPLVNEMRLTFSKATFWVPCNSVAMASSWRLGTTEAAALFSSKISTNLLSTTWSFRLTRKVLIFTHHRRSQTWSPNCYGYENPHHNPCSLAMREQSNSGVLRKSTTRNQRVPSVFTKRVWVLSFQKGSKTLKILSQSTSYTTLSNAEMRTTCIHCRWVVIRNSSSPLMRRAWICGVWTSKTKLPSST